MNVSRGREARVASAAISTVATTAGSSPARSINKAKLRTLPLTARQARVPELAFTGAAFVPMQSTGSAT